MTGPAEESRSGEKHSGGFAQVVRWLTEERPIVGADDVGFVAGAPRRAGRWTYGDPPARPSNPDVEVDALAEVRIGPAPRCAVAGETIALSVSLINTRGGSYLGWPVKLEWSSSDPSIATVNEYGIVEVHARGRVELTCTCEGISGSVLLTVVEPAVAVAVGLPVPNRLVPPTRPAPELRRAPEPPPVHRRSVERGSVKHGAFGLTRGTRRLLFRLAVGAATGAVIAVVLTRSPEEYFVVSAEPTTGLAARRAGATPRRPSVARAGSRPAVAVPASVASSPAATAGLGDTSRGAAFTAVSGRVVSEAAGSAVIPSANAPAPAIAPDQSAPPSRGVAPASATTRVVVASSPSQLVEGESVRLSAASVDDRGDAVAGRGVTWKSEDESVASVDENGVVTARRPGTATIVVATPDGRTGRVTLSVGARRPVEALAPASAPARANSAAAAGQVMRARIEEFVTALRERNSSRVAALYDAESPQDRKNLQALLDRMRRPEARLRVSDVHVGSLEVREMEAGVDFQVPMSWTTPFGRVRNQTSKFRAVLEASDDGWRLVAIRAIGKID
jgi:hypothetical protein